MPVENTPHWRHKAGDCDPWSEPEEPWHLGWKKLFDMSCREIGLRDPVTGELHGANVLVGSGTPAATVLELQHSSISEDERNAREAFYRREHRMFWLVHIHNESSFPGTYFNMSLDFKSRVVNLDGKEFAIMRWMGPTNSSLRSGSAPLPTSSSMRVHTSSTSPAPGATSRLGGPLKRGEFALCALTRDEFVRAVRGEDLRSA